MKISKIFYSLFFSLLLSSLFFAQAKDWYNTLENGIKIKGVSSDKEENFYIIGEYYGWESSFKLGNTEFQSSDGVMFLAKYDKNGNFVWAQQAKSSINYFVESISTDRDGNSYITGIITDTAQFGGIKFPSYKTSKNFYIAKYGKDGNFLWLKQISPEDYESRINSITTDQNGNVYVAGYLHYGFSLTFTDSFILKGGLSGDSFIAKYNKEGVFQWATKSSDQRSYAESVSASQNGNVFVTGEFTGTVKFGEHQITSTPGSSNFYVVKFDSSGNALWAKNGLGYINYGVSVTSDNYGNCFVAGRYLLNLELDTLTFNREGYGNYLNGFVAKYDEFGNLKWAWDAESVFGTGINSLDTDLEGNCYLTGFFSGKIGFESKEIFGEKYDIFIAKFNPEGKYIWAKPIGGEGHETKSYFSVEDNGNIFLGGIDEVKNEYSNFDSRNFLVKYKKGYINISLPSEGEQWEIGTEKAVTWSSNLEKGDSLLIEISTNGGIDWEKLSSDPVDASLGSYSFIVPDKSSNNCRIMIHSPLYMNVYAISETFTIGVTVNVEENIIPQNYSLIQNYPNPFNPSTKITFSIPTESNVRLTIFNTLGEKVKELFSGVKSVGYHEINFDASGLSSGLYFYELEANSTDGKDNFRQIKKMMLIK